MPRAILASEKHLVAGRRGIEVSAQRLPIVDVVYARQVDTEDIDRCFAEYSKLSRAAAREGGMRAYVVDMREFNPVLGTAKYRRYAADVFRAHAGILKPVTVCEARVVSSFATSCILTAFDWLTGTKWPCATFTTMVAAEAWVTEQLRAAGVASPRAERA